MDKLKSRAALVGLLRHNTRVQVPQNADPNLSKKNRIDQTIADSLALYTKLLPKKVRKNAVHAVETVLTASEEWFQKATPEQKQDFFTDSEEWVRKTFGRKNVISVTIHRDEKVPHLHIIAVPLVDGKLNAKKLIGGTKYRMRELQDDYYKKVGEPLGMDRGVKRDKPIRHTEPKEFARVMAEKIAALDQERKELEEVKRGFNKELFDAMNKDIRGVFLKRGISADDTVLFWKSVFETMANFKAIKRESQTRETTVENEQLKGKKR